jgi:nitroimidazol reductase NimA-like FMN-containing flavoprotein (pyridoxamine 5'-phosphate oxidase superfamily)
MSQPVSPDVLTRLESQQNIWFSSVRPNGHPHLTPVWFVWHAGKFYCGIDPRSVKSRNIHLNPHVVLALEDGSHPMICEGTVQVLEPPYSEALLGAFFNKYEWNLLKEEQFNQVVEITPVKWLNA